MGFLGFLTGAWVSQRQLAVVSTKPKPVWVTTKAAFQKLPTQLPVSSLERVYPLQQLLILLELWTDVLWISQLSEFPEWVLQSPLHKWVNLQEDILRLCANTASFYIKGTGISMVSVLEGPLELILHRHQGSINPRGHPSLWPEDKIETVLWINLPEWN